MTEKKKYKIIDMHTHIFPDGIADRAVMNIGKYYHLEMLGKGTVDALLESGKKIGVDYYVVHSSATHVDQVKPINNFVVDTVEKHHNFIGFGTLHPELKDPQDEINRIIKAGLKGIKLHPEFQKFRIDDETMMPIYQAIEGKLPLLIHMGDENGDASSPYRLSRILEKFPEMVVIAAHFGGYRMWEDAIRYLVGKPLYMDTCSSLAFLEPEKAVSMIRLHGAHRFLFGTDYPMWDHSEELKRFMRLELTEKERTAILSGNAEKLLSLH